MAPLLSSDWIPELMNLAISFLNARLGMNLPSVTLGQIGWSQIVVYIVFVAGVVILTFKHPQPTIMLQAKENASLDHDEDFIKQIEKFTSLWGARLDGIDRELNWIDQDFVSLEAEVEVNSTKNRGRKICPLVVALRTIARRQGADRPIVILGEPGLGQSVALRRLGRLLLEESPKKPEDCRSV